MEHPFITSLSDKTLEELQNTISDLYGKLNYAHRSGNSALITQINMVMDSYRAEYNKRMDEMIKKQNISTKINIETGKK
jgi:predicted Zn-dependent protease